MNELITVQAAVELIGKGVPLSLAGPESALDQLPAGNWIGGTTPYFMVAGGGVIVTDGKVFATDLTHVGTVSLACYGPDELAAIAGNAPDNGFSIAIIPAGGQCHQCFAAEAANYPGAFLKPTVGWISGVHLTDIGKVTPKVYDGRTASKFEDRVAVAYVTLPSDKLASVDIVNLFEPDDGDLLRFPTAGFDVDDCEVNGEKVNFAAYVRKRGLQNGSLPLVGDFAGAHVNVSLQQVDVAGGQVALYAPVFPEVDYRFAKPVGDFAAAFRMRFAEQGDAGAVMACNCILNFVFGELEGKAIGGIQGPVTFGEIAYQLLNQTMVAVRVL
ncbi:DUF6976 family protein [Variovorax ginsengisoli]|uniref:Uncharacterized protein n=1 Tax=Variovorax ginsengisoli TaxID=363844 RepID=A0ABT9SGI6_9BURK|nr:hypothetical protein [Variovorax ginsengisoli]MDP9902926.1 hypothetical protein [Variovorax ginsengisoli]